MVFYGMQKKQKDDTPTEERPTSSSRLSMRVQDELAVIRAEKIRQQWPREAGAHHMQRLRKQRRLGDANHKDVPRSLKSWLRSSITAGKTWIAEKATPTEAASAERRESLQVKLDTLVDADEERTYR